MPFSARPSPAVGDTTPAHDFEPRTPTLDAVLSTLAVGVLAADLDGRFSYANQAALRILGVTEQELSGRTLAEAGFTLQDESAAALAPERAPLLRAGADARGTLQAVLRYVRPPALDVWLESQTTALRSPTGALVGSVMSFVDVSDRVRRQAVERTAIARMHDVLRLMAAGVLMVDAEGRIEYANPAAAALSGLKPEQVIGQLAADPAWQLTDDTGAPLPYHALPVPTALRERRDVRGVELGVPSAAGAMNWMRVSALPLLDPDGALRGAVVTAEDVTERHILAEQLLQAQKLEGMGQLAGGIAHDFNNLLTVIIGNAELALAEAPQGSTAAVEVAEIRDAANRGAALTRQMLTFARKQVVQPRSVYLDRLAGMAESLLQRVVGEGVVLRRSSDSPLWPVRVDPGQMEQVLVNMAINARDAMPDGGTLSIEIRNARVEPQQAQAHPGVEPGDFVTIAITDTGTGMSRDLVARIFDPFFTTKPVGSGTGLGLSICHGVVKQARGFISVETSLGRGTTFRIHLPRTHDELTDATPPFEAPQQKSLGTILLVEDQDAVRVLVARALSGYGFEIISAASGQQALALHARMTGRLDLLLTDVVMPEMGGLELARTLQARVPGLPVLYMTGYVDARSAGLDGLIADENLLLKPFTPMQLLQRVQRLCVRAPTAHSA
jgi:two-component system, cell cycle sensor histidine kinase and response regulator CckA